VRGGGAEGGSLRYGSVHSVNRLNGTGGERYAESSGITCGREHVKARAVPQVTARGPLPEILRIEGVSVHDGAAAVAGDGRSSTVVE
jgi:hypothetical protein